MSIRIAIFASGTGSNARKIMEHFQDHPAIRVALVVSNNVDAGVLEIARNFDIKSLIINKKQLNDPGLLESILQDHGIQCIVLAGFLLKIPDHRITAYPQKIVNIHPALLPAFGGKGMYGMHVHEAVIKSGVKESGISIHYVDNQYDHGETIFQARCTVSPDETPESLSKKIQRLEHEHYASVLERLLQNPR